jgi:hypothetical protein
MDNYTLEQTILWRRIDQPGHDACALWSSRDGWRVAGTAVFALDGEPCHLRYEVHCDRSWHSRLGMVDGWIGQKPIDFRIVSIPGQRWTLNGVEEKAVTGCADVDLSFTPATNLLQLRRLALGVGEQGEAPAAWLRFPESALGRLEQTYARVAHERYDYRAPTVEFAAQLEVTNTGFVTRYPGLWEMVALR